MVQVFLIDRGKNR